MGKEKDEFTFRWVLKLLGVKGDTLDASELLHKVREVEREQREELGISYSTTHVRQSVVHSREDIVLLVSRLASLNKSAHNITNRLNIIIVIGLAILALLWL